MPPSDAATYAARVARSAERKRRKKLIFKLSRMLCAMAGEDPDAPCAVHNFGWVTDGTKKFVKRMPEAKRILGRLNYQIEEGQLDEQP